MNNNYYIKDTWTCNINPSTPVCNRFKKYFGSGQSEGGACQDCPHLRLNGNHVILIDGKQYELIVRIDE